MELVAPLSPPATFSFLQVLLAATHITAVGWRCAGCSDCGTRRNVRQHWDPQSVVGCGDWPQCGWQLCHRGTWHGSSSPMAPWWDVVDGPSPKGVCGRVPLSHGMLHGATSSEDRASCSCCHRLHVAAPCPVPCPLLPSFKQLSDCFILSLRSSGLEPLGVKGGRVMPPCQTPTIT